MSKKCINLKDKRFGKLIVLFKTEKVSKDGCIVWRCECDCGNFCDAISSSLMTKRKKSCGCGIVEAVINTNTKHGKSKSGEYNSYRSMIQRCQNPNNTSYKYYFNIGICSRWIKSFENFYEDMGDKPSKKYSIERVDNSIGYYPENCVWGTPDEQSQNQKTTKLDHIKVTYIRERIGMTNKILADKFGVSEETIRQVKKFETWKNIK